jgi:catechol 2,3-dioxygenase-like lactoylglutathione lyase family enzyme
MGPPFAASGLDHVALVVSDMSRSLDWYRSVLGMERRFEDVWDGGGDPVVLCNGEACVALFDPVEGDEIAADGASRHFAIRLDAANFARAREELAGRGVDAEAWDHTICRSLYVRDPDGHQVELTTYEVG